MRNSVTLLVAPDFARVAYIEDRCFESGHRIPLVIKTPTLPIDMH